ncbi:MAG: lysophospholipid acyltransferase family protein [bacterium]|nr:lysophospholipid acyltransferase family protein [bacterium]
MRAPAACAFPSWDARPPPGPALPASLQTGCPVIPMGIVRQPDGSHVLHVGPVLHPEGRTADEAGIRAYTAAISAAVEEFIRRAPAQWFWVHRRWKEADRQAPIA